MPERMLGVLDCPGRTPVGRYAKDRVRALVFPGQSATSRALELVVEQKANGKVLAVVRHSNPQTGTWDELFRLLLDDETGR